MSSPIGDFLLQRRSRRAVKHVDAFKLRKGFAAILAAAADAVLVAHHLPRLGAHLVIVLARLHVKNLVRRIGMDEVVLWAPCTTRCL
jgi:broad-specificity NMP kinase